jgi:hypothetical protein
MKLSHVNSVAAELELKGDFGASWVTRSSEMMAGVPRRAAVVFHHFFSSSLVKQSLPSSVKASGSGLGKVQDAASVSP